MFCRRLPLLLSGASTLDLQPGGVIGMRPQNKQLRVDQSLQHFQSCRLGEHRFGPGHLAQLALETMALMRPDQPRPRRGTESLSRSAPFSAWTAALGYPRRSLSGGCPELPKLPVVRRHRLPSCGRPARGQYPAGRPHLPRTARAFLHGRDRFARGRHLPRAQGRIPTNIPTPTTGHPGTMIVDKAKDVQSLPHHRQPPQELFASLHRGDDERGTGFGRRVLQAVEEFGISFEHLPTGIDTWSGRSRNTTATNSPHQRTLLPSPIDGQALLRDPGMVRTRTRRRSCLARSMRPASTCA